MDFETIYANLPGNGWLSEIEARLLWKYLPETQGAIVEVGSYRGRSTALFAQTDRLVQCIDPYLPEFDKENPRQNYEEFKTVILQKYVNVRHIKSKVENVSSVFISNLLGKIGFVYLDGDHSYQGTINQINFAIQLSPQIIAIHDVNDSGGGAAVKRACLEKLGEWEHREDRLAIWRNE